MVTTVEKRTASREQVTLTEVKGFFDARVFKKGSHLTTSLGLVLPLIVSL